MKNLFKNNLVLDLGSKVSKFRVNNNKPCLEPTTVATLLQGNRIKTLIGNEAVAWPHPVLHSINPFLSGVVSDSKCFDYFLQGIRKKAKKLVPLYRRFLPWNYTIIIHGGMTKLEKEAIANGGLPNCSLIESHELFKGENELILDLGASTCTVVAFNSGCQIGHKIEFSGSNDLSNAIKSFIQDEYSCTILSKSTERLKCTSAKVYEVKGHHVAKKTPMRITVSADEIQRVIDEHNKITVKLVSDLLDKHKNCVFSKIIMTGGAARQSGLKLSLEKELGLPVETAEDPEVFLINSYEKN